MQYYKRDFQFIRFDRKRKAATEEAVPAPVNVSYIHRYNKKLTNCGMFC